VHRIDLRLLTGLELRGLVGVFVRGHADQDVHGLERMLGWDWEAC
jgi:hypothetical protein